MKQEQAGSLSRFVLKNGMTVIINEQYALPVVAVVARIKAGILDEADEASGAAALLARVMRRGTQFRSGEKLASDMRAVGGLMGMETAYDHTSFHFIAPADKSKEALAIQADLVQNPTLAEDEVKKELALLRYDRGDVSAATDNAASYSLSRLMSLAFAGDKIGRAAQPNATLSRDQLLAFYRKHYHPENLIIAVAGAVSTFHTLVEIQRLYGTFKKQELAAPQEGSKPAGATDISNAGKSKSATQGQTANKPQAQAAAADKKATPTDAKPAGQANPAASAQTPAAGAQTPPPAQPPVEALRYTNERGSLHQSIASIGFRLTGLNAKDRATLEVLSALLGEGRGSRLHRSLFTGQQAVHQIQSSVVTFADRGLFVVQLWTPAGALDKAESSLFRELNQLRREIPTAAELSRARLGIENRFFADNHSSLNRARLLASAEAAGGFRSLLDYQKRIRAVTGEDVQRAAARFLTLTNTSVHEYEASTAAPRTFEAEKFAQTVSAWSPTFAEAVDAKAVRAADDKSLPSVNAEGVGKSVDELSTLESIQPLAVKNFSTLNGPQAYVREDHTQPRVTVALLFQGGRMVEEESNAGITELMLRWMLYGTERRPQAALELEQLGAEIEVIGEPDYYGFIVDVLSNNAERALKLVRDLIEEPAFRDEDFKLPRLEQLAKIYQDRDSAVARSRELLRQSLFAGHIFSQPAHGNEAAMARLKEDDVRTWHEQSIKRQMPLVIIVGDTEGSALLSSEIATGFKRNDMDATLRAQLPQVGKPAEKIEARSFSHTVLGLGFPGVKGGSDDLIALDILKAALNGSDGRLRLELRDRQAAAYRAFLEVSSTLFTGTLEFFVATAPENEQRARAALLAEVDKLTKAGISADEFAAAKALARTLALVRLQSQRERALEYARYIFNQKPAADVDTIEARLTKVTADEVKRAASTYLKATAASVSIVRGTTKQ